MYTLAEIRARTDRGVDAWWTVLLSVRLVRRLAGHRRATGDRLTVAGPLLGLAAAACFAERDGGALIAGALLFHLSFVADCTADRVARLTGAGSPFGAWFVFIA